jgi:hypothetical protein
MTIQQYQKKNLLSNGKTNSKTAKNEIKTFILYLAPHTKNSKGFNICAHASTGCIKACLDTAGMGIFSNVQNARIEKSNYFVEYRKEFLIHLAKEINTKVKTARRKGEKIAFRLNGTSDMDFVYLLKKHANFDILETKDVAIYYDYTPNIHRALRYKDHPLYTVTFSRKEDNSKETQTALDNNINTAVVFNKLPKVWKGKKVIDGDKSDLQMLNYKNVILGLIAKGKAKKDTSNFVVTI